AYFGFLAFAFIIAEVCLLLVKSVGEIDAIFQAEYAALSMDQEFEEMISGEIRRWAEEFKDFHLPNSKNGTALSLLIAFRWVMIQNLLPVVLIAAGVGLPEGMLKRAQIKETVGFFSPRRFHLAVGGLGILLSIFPEYLVSPLAVSIIYVGIFLISTTIGCVYWVMSSWPGGP
ncbi:MAG TPA: hypothetical protein VNJ29_00275, partial [Candidatus Nitrosotenuis sp.]|nr:hypothetical protein [Candidatus Nitrosotenuis sp.]